MNNLKRKNQTMMPMSKSYLHETLAANSKRFSEMPNRLDESEMREKLFQVKLKNYNPDKMRAKVRWNLILVVLLSFLVFFGNGVSQYRDKQSDIVFCDSDDYSYLSKESSCTPCPNDGKCAGGKLKSCHNNYIIRDGNCVRNEKLDLLVQKMARKLGKALAMRKGDQMCHSKDADYAFMSVKELKPALSEFNYDKLCDNALEQLKQDLMFNLDKHPNLIREFKRSPASGMYEDFVASKSYEFSLYCKSKMFLGDHKLSVLTFMLSCLTMWALASRALKRRKLSIRAEEIYKKNLIVLQNEGKINRRHLLTNESDRNVKDRDALMEEIERIRLLDEQVTLYQLEGDIYWVLV